MIEATEDIYGGVIIDESTLPCKAEDFQEEFLRLAESLKEKRLLWIRLHADKAEFIPLLTGLGFRYHNCDDESLMLVRKLDPAAHVPATKNYIAGVGAIVLSEGKLLVIRDRHSGEYKLPGGHIDRNESIKEALRREVYEETGVDSIFESIVSLGHFRNGQFGEANLYIVCTAKALSWKIAVNDAIEVAEAQWIDPAVFLSSDRVNNYNKSVVEAAMTNRELKLTERHIKLRVKDGEVFF
jgi:8-oxo-dGTP diphosphatase